MKHDIAGGKYLYFKCKCGANHYIFENEEGKIRYLWKRKMCFKCGTKIVVRHKKF